MNMGAGRVVYQDLTRIDKSIRDGDFFDEPVARRGDGSRRGGSNALHLIGLVSDGGVHSHQRHLLRAHRDGRAARRRRAVRPRHHRRPRHLADRRRPLRRRARGRADEGSASAGSRRSPAATTRWIATSGGSGPKLAYDAMMNGTTAGTEPAPTATSAGAAIQAAYADRRHRRVHQADRHRRRRRHAGRPDPRRRFGHLFQLPRRSRAADHRAPRVRRPVRRLRAPARARRLHATTMTVYDRTFNLPGRRSRRRRSATTSRTCSQRTAAPTCGSPRPRSTRT